MPYLYAYLATTIFYLIVDYLWLGVISKDFYRNQLGDLMLDDVKIHIAALFYILYTIGLVLFAVKLALAADNYLIALGYGAFLGFLAYGTYDVTNIATLKDWPVLMSVVDVAWGTALSGISATIGYFIARQFV